MNKNENENEVVSFKVITRKCLYNSPDFKIYSCEPSFKSDSELQDLKMNTYGGITIKGDFQELDINCGYTVRGVAVEDKKYGYGYTVQNIRRDVPNTIETSRQFLLSVITEQQTETLLAVYPDIVSRIVNDDLDGIDLNKTKGIKEYTFDVIKRKVIENFKLAELVEEYGGVFSLAIIRKLYDTYPSIEKIRDNLVENPYECLCKLGGVGFKSADELLLKLEKESKERIKQGKKSIIQFSCDLISSYQRMKSCIVFLIEQSESEGNTYIDGRELHKQCKEIVPEAIHNFADVLKNEEDIHFDRDSAKVAKIYTYNTEKYIADRIKEGLAVKNIWNVDYTKYYKVDDFELSDEQKQTCKNVCENTITILSGNAGCVDCDTEYFNGTEWRKISEFIDGDKVLQYNPDGSAELVYPRNYIKHKAEYLWHFSTKYGLDQCLSDNHNCYYITSKGNLYHKTFREIRENHESSGFKGSFITTFHKYGTGIDLSNDEIRLLVATFADGSFTHSHCSDEVYTRVRFHLKKERKKERLVQLINNLHREYRVAKSAAEGYDDYFVNVPFRCKHFPKEWYNCSKEQMEVIMDEIVYWDCSYKNKNNFSTVTKSDADFIQYITTCLGYRATISVQDRTGQDYITNGKIYQRQSVEYEVTWCERTLIKMCYDKRISHSKTAIEQYKTIDGYEYCFTVPSGMLVLRRSNKIFITGNSGKSFSTKALINLLNDNNKHALLLAPTGRASKVLADYANHPASTIHRGLGFKPPKTWNYNEETKLDCDIVILDEFSMVDIFLFRHLLEAIDFTKTKLLLIGDDAQIPSVSCGNLLHDFLNAGNIPTVRLTKIFRYGKGGINTVATDIRTGKPSFDKNNTDTQIIGNDKGFIYTPIAQEKAINYIVKLYKKLLEKGIDKNDILILISQNIGDYGTQRINKRIQFEVNPDSDKYVKYGETEYRVNDLVIQCVNNYKSYIYTQYGCNDEKTFISNGEIGKIVDVVYDMGEYGIVVDFGNKNLIFIPKSQLGTIKLGYAISVHRSQGSQSRYVIVFAPKAHSYMLNSNLLYVGVTRAKEKCILIGELETYNRSIKKKENLARNTFMCELLKKE